MDSVQSVDIEQLSRLPCGPGHGSHAPVLSGQKVASWESGGPLYCIHLHSATLLALPWRPVSFNISSRRELSEVVVFVNSTNFVFVPLPDFSPFTRLPRFYLSLSVYTYIYNSRPHPPLACPNTLRRYVPCGRIRKEFTPSRSLFSKALLRVLFAEGPGVRMWWADKQNEGR